MTNYPTSLDSLTNPTATDSVATVDHAAQHANANDAIEALQAKVGADSSAVTSSHDYKLSEVTSTDKAVGKTATQTLTNKTLTSPTLTTPTVNGSTGTGVNDYGGATSFEIPNSAAPTVDANGEVAVDTTVTDFSHGVMKYFGGEEMAVIAVPVGELTSPSDGDIITYNSTSDEFQLTQPSAANNLSGTFTADEDLTIGQPVGISNIISGKVARSNRSSTTVTLSILPATGVGIGKLASIGGDKFVAITDQTSDDSLYATVLSVNTSTKSVTAGTSSAATADINAYWVVCKLDTDKFVVFYTEDASTTIIKYRAATVSGTTISWGTAATFVTGGTAINSITCDQVGTDKVAVFYGCATATDSKVVCATFSGTTATVGTPASVGTTLDNDISNTFIKKIGTDKVMFGSGSKYAQVGTLSGTTFTVGSEVQYTSDTVSSQLQAISLSTDSAIIAWYDGTQVGYCVASTVSGTTPTFGSTTTGSQNDNFIVYGSSSSFYRQNGGSDTLRKYTVSGTSITDAGLVMDNGTFAHGGNGDLGVMLYMDGGYMISVQDNGSSVYQFWIEGMSNNFIGIAQSTVSKGASVSVTLRGVDSNQSSLVPGMYYRVDSGSLTAVDANSTVNSADDKFLIAISATSIVV